jgi:hypothetical protein
MGSGVVRSRFRLEEDGLELGRERFERYGWMEGFGVLRFAQDDSKNRQQQKQIPSLRCGMTNKRTRQ